MNNTKVNVIMSRCVWDKLAECWCSRGEQLVFLTFPTLEEAMAKGESLREKGMGVIVRPTYNEEDENGRFFREWRSFSGETLKEVRFPYMFTGKRGV